MFNQTIRRMLHKYDFHGRKVQQQKKDVWWVEETVKIGFDFQKKSLCKGKKKIERRNLVRWNENLSIRLRKLGCGESLIDETIRKI